MKKIVIASTTQSAGKTSIVIGLIKASGKKVGYLKPLGDRLLYQKKRQWDYDSSVITSLIGLKENPEEMTIGFEHSKLHYMYDEAGINNKLAETVKMAAAGHDFVIIEGGKNFSYGISVHLDCVSIAKNVGGKIFFVVSGSDAGIVDDLTLLKLYMDYAAVDFGGIIINKVKDIEDFKITHLPTIEKLGINVLGVIPFTPELTYLSLSFIADRLFAKILAGENNLNKIVKRVVIGAMSASSAIHLPLFGTESKLVITSGDRSDMIIAALETNAAGIVLTNNVLPPSNIISRASDQGIPLLLVGNDTFSTAKQIDDMEPLITKDDTERATKLGELVKKYVNTEEIWKN